MPKYRNVNVVCPDCGKSFKVKQFTSIDSDSRQGQLVDQGRLFEEKCPYCHQVHEYPYSFTLREKGTYKKIVYAVNEEDKQEYLEDYEGEEDVRITDSEDDFAEKRQIFQMGYDDRIIEVEKIIALKGMQIRNPKVNTTVFAGLINKAGMENAVIYGEADGEVLEIVPADPVYHRLEKDLDEKLVTFEEPTLIVDHAWAEKFLSYAEMNPDEIGKMEDFTLEEEEEPGISYFFNHVEELEYSGNEKKAAEYIIDNFDETWDQIMKENDSKSSLWDLDDQYGNVINATGDLSMILMNEKKYKECMHVMKKIIDTTDLSKDKLSYMNMRRDYMYCIGETEGFYSEKKYLEEWMKETPDDPYLYGTEIDIWLFKDKEKARELALKYVDTPLKDDADEWLLDSCENVARDTGDQDLMKKITKRRKEIRKF